MEGHCILVPDRKVKQGTAIALAIDAMDLLYQRCLDGVALISSDGDFMRLAFPSGPISDSMW